MQAEDLISQIDLLEVIDSDRSNEETLCRAYNSYLGCMNQVVEYLSEDVKTYEADFDWWHGPAKTGLYTFYFVDIGNPILAEYYKRLIQIMRDSVKSGRLTEALMLDCKADTILGFKSYKKTHRGWLGQYYYR